MSIQPEVLKAAIADIQAAEAINLVNKVSGDLVKAGKFRAAKVGLCRALTVDPHNPTLWCNLSSVMWNLRSFEDALAAAKMSLQLNPSEDPKDCIQALIGMGNAYTSLGDYDLALKSFDEVIRLDDLNLDARWNRSLLLLMLGDYTGGFKDYGLRIDWHKRNQEETKENLNQKYKSPEWRGEDLGGKTILVLHDQGYGDTILYSRFLIQDIIFKADRVYFSTVQDLTNLMWKLKAYPNFEFTYPGAPLPDVDYHVHLGSLPKIFGLSGDNIPQNPGFINSRASDELLQAGPQSILLEEPKFQPSLKVGVCWSGRPDFGRNDERMIPFKLLTSLAENPYIWLYSLQMGEAQKDIAEYGMEQFIRDLSPEISQKGWVGTATAMLQLDIVVTCCTSVAHLAGALGVPCWTLLHTEPYWIWGTDPDSTPWYPNTRLFRQRRDRRGDWTCVLEEVRSELSKLVQRKISQQKEPSLAVGELTL